MQVCRLVLGTLLMMTSVMVYGKKRAAQCPKAEALEVVKRLSKDFIFFFNSGEHGQIFKRLMKQGATITSLSAYPECMQVTTNMRTTLIEQYQAGARLGSLDKSTFWSADDGSVILNVAHFVGKMGVDPVLMDIKFFLQAENGCDYRIQSMSQTPYGCLKSSL